MESNVTDTFLFKQLKYITDGSYLKIKTYRYIFANLLESVVLSFSPTGRVEIYTEKKRTGFKTN